MDIDTARRRHLGLMLGALLLPAAPRAQIPGGEQLIRINIPGPQSLLFLPIDLIPLLGFDHEMGGRLIVRYQASGVRGLEDVLAGNADFAGLGFAALPVMRAKGQQVVAIAPLSGRTPALSLILRKDLAGTVRRVADLRGRTIAAPTGTINSKTYMQMAAEAFFATHGIRSGEVRWLPTQQSMDSLSGALLSKSADATFCEDPFAYRLLRSGLGTLLVELGDPVAAQVPGFHHQRTVIATSRTLASEHPERIELFVRMLRRVLVWMQSSPPETIARKAPAGTEAEHSEIAALLRKTPGLYNPDARFVPEQIAATDVFLKNAQPGVALPPAATLVEARWAGRRP